MSNSPNVFGNFRGIRRGFKWKPFKQELNSFAQFRPTDFFCEHNEALYGLGTLQILFYFFASPL